MHITIYKTYVMLDGYEAHIQYKHICVVDKLTDRSTCTPPTPFYGEQLGLNVRDGKISVNKKPIIGAKYKIFIDKYPNPTKQVIITNDEHGTYANCILQFDISKSNVTATLSSSDKTYNEPFVNVCVVKFYK